MGETKNSQRWNTQKTQTVVGLGLLTAIVIVLQTVAATGIQFGPFNITLCLAPIIVGAALYGWKAGAWLGFVFGVVVLFTNAGAFLAINVPGTIITVILKGTLAGLVTGIVYTLVHSLISKKSKTAADFVTVLIVGVIAPIVNTGVFLLGCCVFFLDTLRVWGEGAGFNDVFSYMIFGLVSANFPVELAINFVLSSAITIIINLGKRILRVSK